MAKERRSVSRAAYETVDEYTHDDGLSLRGDVGREQQKRDGETEDHGADGVCGGDHWNGDDDLVMSAGVRADTALLKHRRDLGKRRPMI